MVSQHRQRQKDVCKESRRCPIGKAGRCPCLCDIRQLIESGRLFWGADRLQRGKLNEREYA